MFDGIAPRYDLLNHLLSFGTDIRWRKRFVRLLEQKHPRNILDIATGTGDLALAMARLKPESITGIDISENMIALGREKVAKKKLSGIVTFIPGDAESIPFPEGSFDAVTVAFGARNFSDLRKGLSEMKRILGHGGTMMILEFSHPDKAPFRQLYRMYSSTVIPITGRLISRHKVAYNYLPETVRAFPSGRDFLEILEESGLKNCRSIPLTYGIATIYLGEKE